MQRVGAAILSAITPPGAGGLDSPIGLQQAQIGQSNTFPSSRGSNSSSIGRLGALSLPVVGAAAFLALRKKALKPHRERTIWSSKSLTGKAIDEQPRGLWEIQVWGYTDESGVWHKGRWQENEDRGQHDWFDTQWLQTYRMEKATFEFIYNKYGRDLERQDTNRRFAIPGRKRLAVFLDWLASGASYKSLARTYDISPASISGIVRGAVQHLRLTAAKDAITLPTGRDLQHVMREFELLCHLPGVCGALDGTFVEIAKPVENGNLYWCYKHMYAITRAASRT